MIMARITKTPETTKPTTEAAKPTAAPPVTFDVNDPAFQAIVAQAVAARLAAIEAEKPVKISIAGKTEKAVKNEIATVRAFKRAGFGTVKPHEDVLTFNKWAAKGFRPKEGTKSVKVANLRLFHVSQVRKLTTDEVKALKHSQEAAVSRHAADNVTPLHQ
jgi:hypothetical protein